jgi:hypothetical protein
MHDKEKVAQRSVILVSAKGAKTKTSNRRGGPWRIAYLLFLSMILFTLEVASSKASDVEALSKMLAGAFIADQVVFMCSLDGTSFARQTAGTRGTSREYVEHVKGEVLNSIPVEEAKRIVIGAADITRTVGRSQARKFSPNYPDIPAAALRRWCDSDGAGIVHDFMTNHDTDHDNFLRAVADAKRPMM